MSDSFSVIEAIFSFKYKYSSSFIYDIRNLLLHSNSIIHFVWISSHRGITGNETVDNLAKAATKQGLTTNIFLPFSDFNEQINHNMKKRHFNYLGNNDTNKGIYYFSNFYSQTMKTWFKVLLHFRWPIKSKFSRIFLSAPLLHIIVKLFLWYYLTLKE